MRQLQQQNKLKPLLKRLRVIFKHLWKAWSKLKQPSNDQAEQVQQFSEAIEKPK